MIKKIQQSRVFLVPMVMLLAQTVSHGAFMCKTISSQDLHIPANTTGYDSIDMDMSTKFNLERGEILVRASKANTVNGDFKVNDSNHITFDITGTREVYLKAIHGRALGGNLKDKIFVRSGAGYTLTSPLTNGLTAGNNVNSGYFIKNNTSSKIINNQDFTWMSDIPEKYISFGTTSTTLNSKIELEICIDDTVSREICGNGKLEGREECDDSNNQNGDGCSASCMIEVLLEAPSVEIIEDINNDGKINTSNELQGDVDVKITFSSDVSVGDILNLVGPNGVTREVVITQSLLTQGYTTSYPPLENGSMVVSATLIDSVGNRSPEGSDTAIIVDTTPPTAPHVEIVEDINNDGRILTLDELSGEIDVLITLSRDVKVGDILSIVNPDGSNIDVTVTQAILDNGHRLLYPPIEDMIITVSATVKDSKGNTSLEGTDSAIILDNISPEAPTVEILEDINNDGEINKFTELEGNIDVRITLPGNVVIRDILSIINPDGSTNNLSISQDMIDNGYDFSYPVMNGVITVIATVQDAVGNASPEGRDSAILVDDQTPTAPFITTINDDREDSVTVSTSKPAIEGVCEAGFTVELKIDAVTINPSAICTDNGTFSILPQKDILAGTHSVTATQKSKNGQVSAVSQSKTIIVSIAVPDYSVTLEASGTIIGGAKGDVSMVIRIAEHNNVKNTKGKLSFTVIKNPNLTLSFDSQEVQRDDQRVENVLWKVTELEALYLFTYIGNNDVFPGFSTSRIGISGVFTSPPKSKGQFTLDVTISKSAGDSNMKNNKDTDILEYKYLN